MTRQLTSAEANERIELVRSAGRKERGRFIRLVERARLDPGKDLRFGNWSGVDFSGCNLAGYDFTGSVLMNCRFKGARIKGATFAQVEFGNESTEAWRLAEAKDWKDLSLIDGSMTVTKHLSEIDEHITVGTFFQDAAVGPLMECIFAAQPDGTGAKYAIQRTATEYVTAREHLVPPKGGAAKSAAAVRMYIEHESRTGCSTLNRMLGLPEQYCYWILFQELGEYKGPIEIPRNTAILLHDAESSRIMASGRAEFDARTGLVICKNWRKDDPVALVSHDGVVRRMASGNMFGMSST